MGRSRFVAWVAAGVLLAGGVAPSAVAQDVVVFGAGSLRDVMTRLAADYGQAHKLAVKTEFGPSGLMRERIERGDKADLLASADVGHPLKLRADGRADHVGVFARNSVCAFAPTALGLTPDGLLARLVEPAVKIGIAAANADPLGDYTQEIFKLADGLRPGSGALLREKSRVVVGGVLPRPGVPPEDPAVVGLRDRSLDVYLGYCSGRQRFARELPEVQAVTLPPALRVGPEYSIARLTGAAPAATGFLLYVMSPEGQRTLVDHGFLPVALPAS